MDGALAAKMVDVAATDIAGATRNMELMLAAFAANMEKYEHDTNEVASSDDVKVPTESLLSRMAVAIGLKV